MTSARAPNAYLAALGLIFQQRFAPGMSAVAFGREDIVTALRELGLPSVKNLGDTIYAARFRGVVPQQVLEAAPAGKEWCLEITGRATYAFKLYDCIDLSPRAGLAAVQIPDSTPEIIRAYRLGDEQARLATIRYNRLVDIFLGLTAYSAQNHLRTTLAAGNQIEIDELYVGVDATGARFAIPVQAKGGSDSLSAVQAGRTSRGAGKRCPMPNAGRCRPISSPTSRS